MDDVERRISAGVQTFSRVVEQSLVTSVRILALPITLPVKLAKASVPPVLHIVIFLSLLPLLGLFSLIAGLLVARRIPSGWTVPAYLQYGQDTTPYAFSTISGLSTNQPYDISVHLVVPHIQANYDLGNFMTALTLMSTSNRTVVTSQKSALLLQPSAARSLLASKSSTIVVPLFNSLVPTYSTLRAKLEVGREDRWKGLGNGEGKELAVIEAYIKGNVKLRGLTALMAISPMTTGVITAVTFFCTATIIALVLYFTFAPSFSPEQEIPPVVVKRGETPKREREIKPILRPTRRPSVEIKTEPSTSSERSPLRRRRSRLSDRTPSPPLSSGRG